MRYDKCTQKKSAAAGIEVPTNEISSPKKALSLGPFSLTYRFQTFSPQGRVTLQAFNWRHIDGVLFGRVESIKV